MTPVCFGYIINLMKKITHILFCVFVLSLMLGGCASGSFNLQSLAGINISDLEHARSSGKEMTVPLSYDAAYDKVMEIIRDNKLTVFREGRKQGYIVVIGFPKQETTTRVGIFFDRVDDGSTKITLSCLSSTCLARAQNIIFGGLEK